MSFNRKEYMKEYSKKNHKKYYNKERSRQGAAKFRAEHPVGYLLYAAKYRCKQLDIPFSITEEDLEQPTHCPIFGYELEYQAAGCGSGKRLNHSASLERIYPDHGYIKGNVIIISWHANRLKNNATLEEIGKIYNFYTELLSKS